MNTLIKSSEGHLKTLTTATQMIKWAVENGINKKISLQEFKKELLCIGIDFKKIKRNPNQNQMYNEDISEVRIKGVSKVMSKQLGNIAKNLGVGISAILKPKIREIVDSYPDNLKVRRNFD